MGLSLQKFSEEKQSQLRARSIARKFAQGIKGTSAPQHNTAKRYARHGPFVNSDEMSLENRYFYLDKHRALEAKCCAAGWYRKKQWFVSKELFVPGGSGICSGVSWCAQLGWSSWGDL